MATQCSLKIALSAPSFFCHPHKCFRASNLTSYFFTLEKNENFFSTTLQPNLISLSRQIIEPDFFHLGHADVQLFDKYYKDQGGRILIMSSTRRIRSV